MSALQLKPICRLLGIDPIPSTFEQIYAHAQDLQKDKRQQVVRECKLGLRNLGCRAIERFRVAIAKTIVAVLPESEDLIEQILSSSNDDLDFEMHFSLFCFLNHAAEIPDAEEFSRRLPQLVGAYLHRIETETAHAAWMAGDLLGDHWSVEDAIPVLLEEAQTAQFPAGREAAIHGLLHAMSKVSSEQQLAISEIIEAASLNDVDEGVRAFANLVRRSSCCGG